MRIPSEINVSPIQGFDCCLVLFPDRCPGLSCRSPLGFQKNISSLLTHEIRFNLFPRWRFACLYRSVEGLKKNSMEFIQSFPGSKSNSLTMVPIAFHH